MSEHIIKNSLLWLLQFFITMIAEVTTFGSVTVSTPTHKSVHLQHFYPSVEGNKEAQVSG